MDKIVSCENLITDIMFQGFKKAEDSFSRFVGDKISIINSEGILYSSDVLLKIENSATPNTIVLTTDLMGAFEGRSYLFITEEESEIIHTILGKQFKSIMSHEFLNAMLLEIDNVISAAVITELSNKLKITLYGGVPGVLHVIERKEFSSYKEKEFADNKMLFYVTRFQMESNSDMNLKFIWKLHPKVLELVSTQSGNSNNA